MIALKIEDIKLFMNRLLKEPTFDEFELVSLEFLMEFSFKIDGAINKDYFTSEELEQHKNQQYVRWSELRNTIFMLIKGHKTPTSIKMVLSTSERSKQSILQKSGAVISPDDIFGFSLNIIFENGSLKVITGTNYKTFTLDKTPEKAFDEMIIKFFNKHEIPFMID